MDTRWNREAVLTSTHNLCFEQKHEKYQNFVSENFHFLVVKIPVFLNRHVFIMRDTEGKWGRNKDKAQRHICNTRHTNTNELNPFMPCGLFYLKSLIRSITYIRGVGLFLLLLCFKGISEIKANSVDPDQMPHHPISGKLGLNGLNYKTSWKAQTSGSILRCVTFCEVRRPDFSRSDNILFTSSVSYVYNHYTF